MTFPHRSDGALLSLAVSCAAWLIPLTWWAGGPWWFDLVFVLLGLTGAVVGAAAALVERTRVAFAALVLGSAAPIVTVAWIFAQPSDWLS